jgi:hypothetical protein
MFTAIKDALVGGSKTTISDKFNSVEFKDVGIDLSVLNQSTKRGKVVSVAKLNEVLEECKRLHPDMAFDKYSIEKRKKLLQRVDDQIRNAEKEINHWRREQTEFKAVEHLDRLVLDLHSEVKMNTTFQANGMLGGRPQKRSREEFSTPVAANPVAANKRFATEDLRIESRLNNLYSNPDELVAHLNALPDPPSSSA